MSETALPHARKVHTMRFERRVVTAADAGARTLSNAGALSARFATGFAWMLSRRCAMPAFSRMMRSSSAAVTDGMKRFGPVGAGAAECRAAGAAAPGPPTLLQSREKTGGRQS